MADQYRANYALLTFLEHLGPNEESLDAPWADFVGDRSSTRAFSVPTADATDVYVEVQAYDVDGFGHEILINGEQLAGFDIPPSNGWQYWMDAVTDRELEAGENTLQIRRDTSTVDALVVGNVVVNWREPVE